MSGWGVKSLGSLAKTPKKCVVAWDSTSWVAKDDPPKGTKEVLTGRQIIEKKHEKQ